VPHARPSAPQRTLGVGDAPQLAIVVAAGFHTATGATPSALARLGAGRYHVAILAARDVVDPGSAFHDLVREAAVLHWQANLSSFAPLLEVARSLRGTVPQVATVHHLEPGEEQKLAALEGAADIVHVPAAQVGELVRSRVPHLPVVEAPYLVDAPTFGRGWRTWVRPWQDRGVAPFQVGWTGMSSGLDDRKRLDVVVRAAVEARRSVPELRLELSGRMPAEVLELARRYRLPVRRWPWRRWHARWEFFRALDCYLSCSSVEGGPLPVFEAAVAGRPVITTPVGLAAELLAAGGGVEVAIGDVDATVEALVALAGLSAAERASQGARDGARADAIVGRQGRLAYDHLWSLAGRPVATTSWGPAAVADHNAEVLRRDAVIEGCDLVRHGRRTQAALAAADGRVWRLEPLERRDAMASLRGAILRR